MARIKHVRVGDVLTDKLWNDITDKLEPWSKFNIVQGSFLELTTGPSGKQLSLRVPQDIPARLVGSSSPYSWVSLVDAPSGMYTDRTAGMTGGTNNAYEINDRGGLDGKPVLLTRTTANDWRFQWIGLGAPPCGGTPGCVRDFPTTAYVGDGLGTTAMTQTFVNDVRALWVSPTPAVFSATAWDFNFGTGKCTEDGSSVYVWYRFELICQEDGKFFASLAKMWNAPCCDLSETGTPGPFAFRYGSDSTMPPPLTGEIIPGLIHYPCGATVFDFDYPTERVDDGNCVGQSLPTPGGGGILSVTF